MELQGEFAKSSLETFVQESQKISGLYADLAKEAYKPFEEFASKLTPKSMG